MTSWHATARRNTVIAVVCASLGVVGVGAVVLTSVRGVAGTQLRALYEVFGGPLVERCLADPATFGVRHPGRVEIYAYDPETLRSANPDAPPIDPLLRDRLADGEDVPSRLHLGGEWGGAVLLRTGREGPCGLAQVHFAPAPEVRPTVVPAVAVGSMVTLVLATALATSLTVRPLLRRVDTLRDAAARIGTTGYRAAPRDAADPLDVLAGVLDEAHRRTTEEREREAARRRALEDHLDDVAHDLRTPLAALQLRLEEAADAAPEVVRAQLNQALGDVTYLAHLTANLRAATILREGADDERVDLGAVVLRVADRFEVIARRLDVTVAVAAPDGPVWAACAPALAEQAVANLVHNAVRHNRAGGNVSVLLEVVGDSFRVEVADDGPGVPPERLATLGTVAPEGSRRGLGLRITSAVSRRAGWALRFSAGEPGLVVELTGRRAPDPQVR